MDAREQALAAREAEALKREEQQLQADKELSTQRADLEAREGKLAEAIGKHDEEVARHKKLVEKSNRQLAARKEEAEKDVAAKQKEYRSALAEEYAGKFRKQEDRFKKKRADDNARIIQLEHQNANLNSRVRRARDGRRRAEEARERADQDLASLMADMRELGAQAGPVVERAAEDEHSVQAARVLTQQRERVFKSLVTRGNTLAGQLGVDAPVVPVHGNADAATYLAYFDQLLTVLEGPVAELGDVVDEECCKLLTVAIDRVFANLQRLHPGFDFESVTEPIEGDPA